MATLLADRPSSINQDIKSAKSESRPAIASARCVKEITRHPANAAMAALITWGGPDNEDAVVAVLKSTSDMQSGALRALAAWGTRKSLPAVTAVAQNSGSPLAAQAQETVKAINGRTRK